MNITRQPTPYKAELDENEARLIGIALQYFIAAIGGCYDNGTSARLAARWNEDEGPDSMATMTTLAHQFIDLPIQP